MILLRPPCLWRTENPTAKARTGALPSRYLQHAFAVPPATCLYSGVRVCTSVARRRCVGGTTHVCGTCGHILPAQSIYSELIIGIPERLIFILTLLNTVKTHQLTWHGTPQRLGLLWLHLVAEGQCRNNLIMALIIRERQWLQEERRVLQYWVRPWIERWRLNTIHCSKSLSGNRTFCWSWWAECFPLRLFGALTLRFGSHLLAELTIMLGIISFKTRNLWCYQLGKCLYHALR